MLHLGEPHGGRHALQRLPHDGLGGAGLAGVVQAQHQQEDLLVLPDAAHLPALETGETVASHGFHSNWSLVSQVAELHH